MTQDEEFFSWAMGSMIFMFLAPILLFAAWDGIGPSGMLLSFAISFGCLLRSIWVGFIK
jgi:hypothetical protein